MKSWLMATTIALALTASQSQDKLEWIDPDTGHRIVRLTDTAGGSTLYFHDNAFSPEGDTLMFNTPNGIAVVNVAKIGNAELKPELVAQGRGGYFARRSRDIYFTNGNTISAVDSETRRVREVPHARGLINADETLALVK